MSDEIRSLLAVCITLNSFMVLSMVCVFMYNLFSFNVSVKRVFMWFLEPDESLCVLLIITVVCNLLIAFVFVYDYVYFSL